MIRSACVINRRGTRGISPTVPTSSAPSVECRKNQVAGSQHRDRAHLPCVLVAEDNPQGSRGPTSDPVLGRSANARRDGFQDYPVWSVPFPPKGLFSLFGILSFG